MYLAGHLEVEDRNIFGTFVFKRKDFDACRPFAMLPSTKPTIMVKCSPIFYELRPDVNENFMKYALWNLATPCVGRKRRKIRQFLGYILRLTFMVKSSMLSMNNVVTLPPITPKNSLLQI